MRSGWLVVILIAGCGGGSVNPDGIRGGSRLEARFLTADGGAREFRGFHDTELDADCWFQLDGDDELRCLPSIASSGYHSNAACTAPVAWHYAADECSGLADYVGTYATGCVYGVDRIWEIGAELAPSAPIYGFDAAGDCIVVARDPGYVYYGVGDEMEADRFVAGHLENRGDGRLMSRDIVGDDGSRLPSSTFDRETDSECWWMNDHCMPVFSYGSYDSDDACSMPVVGRSGTCDPVEPYIGSFRRVGCQYEYTVYENAGLTTPTTLFLGSGADSCVPATITEDEYYAAGDELDPGAFPAVARELGSEAGRIQSYWSTGDGYRAASYGFHDAELDVDCWPQEVTAGEFRCLPSDLASTIDVYTDDRCVETTRLAEIYEPGECGDPSTPLPTRALDWEQAGPCVGYAVVHEIGVEVASGTPYSLDTGICAPATWDTAVVHRHRLGAVVPLDQFAAFRPTTD